MTIQIQSHFFPDITGALIDMDGVATQCTDRLNFEATREVLAAHGVKLAEDNYRLARGRSREEGISRILAACGREDLYPKVPAIAEEKNVAANRLRERLKPVDVPNEDRAILAKLRNLGLWLALGTTSKNGLDTLNRVQLTSMFDAIITGHEAPNKMDIWRLALQYFNARGQETIVFEDAQAGIDAAGAQGVRFSVAIGSDASLQATVHAAHLGDLVLQGG